MKLSIISLSAIVAMFLLTACQQPAPPPKNMAMNNVFSVTVEISGPLVWLYTIKSKTGAAGLIEIGLSSAINPDDCVVAPPKGWVQIKPGATGPNILVAAPRKIGLKQARFGLICFDKVNGPGNITVTDTAVGSSFVGPVDAPN